MFLREFNNWDMQNWVLLVIIIVYKTWWTMQYMSHSTVCRATVLAVAPDNVIVLYVMMYASFVCMHRLTFFCFVLRYLYWPRLCPQTQTLIYYCLWIVNNASSENNTSCHSQSLVALNNGLWVCVGCFFLLFGLWSSAEDIIGWQGWNPYWATLPGRAIAHACSRYYLTSVCFKLFFI